MTADVEMLPELVDEGLDFFNLAGDEGDKLYVRAIRQHIAAKDAEIDALRTRLEDTVRDSTNKIEALRAKVERLTFEMERLQQQYDERTACMIVHRGSALACSDAVRAAYSEEHERAERLAEALRPHIEDLEQSAVVLDQYPAMAPTAAEMRKAAAELRAALNPTAAQENDDA